MNINERCQIDIFEMKNVGIEIVRKNDKYRYFFAYRDTYSNFIFLKPLVHNDVNEIAEKLTDVFALIGAPKILESGNGMNFCEKLIKAIEQHIPNLKIVINEKKVETELRKNLVNRDLENLIARWKKNNPERFWHEGLKFVQIYENTQHLSNGEVEKSPAELMFGKFVHQNLQKLMKHGSSHIENGDEASTDGWGQEDDNSIRDNVTEEPNSKKQRYNPNSNEEIANGFSKSQLQCKFCQSTFNFPSVLERHMRMHTNERPFICKICNKSFKQSGHLSQHSMKHANFQSTECKVCFLSFESSDLLKDHSIATNHDNNPDEIITINEKSCKPTLECEICNKVFTTKSVLERHVSTHSDERKFGCKVCGKRFKQAGHVKSHMLVHTGEKKFECEICRKRFSLSNSLKKHMYVHNGEKPYQCDICGSRFLEKRNLNGHLMTHTNEKPFCCEICGKRYTLADTLRRHVIVAHEQGRTFQCEICAKMFKQLAHLSVHQKIHTDERPFQCHLCDKNFKHKNVLQSHLAIHANIRPFECDTCKSTFVRKTNLVTHITSAHMDERPYVCKICDKRFKQISHLNGHAIVHSNSMPYQCDYCERRCNRLDNLKKHMKLHTKMDKKTP